MINIKAYTLFDEWKLYDPKTNSWTNWFLYNIGFNVTQSNIEEYLFNLENGGVYNINNMKIGQFGQENEDPYIYMDDGSYIRLLSEYESRIKESDFAKRCHKIYLDTLISDI
jgi:hypothetical protein